MIGGVQSLCGQAALSSIDVIVLSYLWTGLFVVILLILFLLVVLKLREQKAKNRIAQLECDRLDAEAFRRQLQCEVLDSKVKEQIAEIERIQKENLEITRQLALAPGDASEQSKLQQLESILNKEYGDFLKNLKVRYPQLSDNDYLILGLIRMELPSRDIAAVLSITPASFMKARYRLRQKMQLSKSDDLNAIVMDI